VTGGGGVHAFWCAEEIEGPVARGGGRRGGCAFEKHICDAFLDTGEGFDVLWVERAVDRFECHVRDVHEFTGFFDCEGCLESCQRSLSSLLLYQTYLYWPPSPNNPHALHPTLS
jgi:hypothetical protein